MKSKKMKSVKENDKIEENDEERDLKGGKVEMDVKDSYINNTIIYNAILVKYV